MAEFNDQGLPIHDDGIETRVLGTLRRPRGVRLMAAGAVKLVPQSEWREFDYRTQAPPWPILDQDGKGACVGHATATALMAARWLAGASHVDLSPWFIYSILCNGIDRGASISEALDLATKTGTCRFDRVPYGTINPRSLSAEARRDATNYRIEIGAETATFDEMMSEAQRDRVGNFSIGVGAGFNNLDADGCVSSTGSLNHSVSYGYGAKKDRNGEWCLLCLNSWTAQWGDGGYFWIRKRNIYRGNDSWSILSPLDTPGDVLNPPVAI